ncbi:MAG: DUF4199 domain-containing protein [Flavobacterium sp.]|uniref:DUF4199 domain-containing protein n=1 Tax=Flavobacterium sp. TaxID=239 RepID=UPI00326760A7
MNAIFKKNAITFGVISGLIGIGVTTLMYLIDLKLFVNMWIGFGMLAMWIVIGCILLSKSKKENQGVMTFKEGFTTYFLSAVIGILISTAFNILLFNFIDTGARETVTEHLLDMQVGMIQKFGGTQAQINEAIANVKENSQFSLKGQLMGIGQAMIGAIIFGLILAAIFKSKNKESF